MPLFDAKLFNGEVFNKYYETIPNLKLNKLIQSGAIRQRQDLVNVMSDQVAGNYITTPMLGLLGGTPSNYDGATNITADSTNTFSHSRVVVGRAKAWVERDFSYDITGGVDFMANVANQVHDFWTDYDQETLINILTGIFSMSGVANRKFVDGHTSDITSVTNSENELGKMDATTLNSAIQKALGDNKSKFSLIVMHSAVATHLENLKLLTYAKMNDADGLQRDTSLATLNGRLVLVDDSMPVTTVAATYKVTADTSVVTGKTYYTSEGVETTFATGVYEVDTPAYDTYTSYVLGAGAIEFTDCGAKVPFEMHRDPKSHGGEDTLYTRQRKCFAPYGINFTKTVMSSTSPTDEELRNGSNWSLVNSNESGQGKPEYIDHRAIPIARIISRG